MTHGDPRAGRVLVLTSDLTFRAKLEELLRRAGREPVRAGPAQHALVELAGTSDIERVRELVQSGSRVVAFGPHVQASLLRAARLAGAEAVPNSRIEEKVRERFRPT